MTGFLKCYRSVCWFIVFLVFGLIICSEGLFAQLPTVYELLKRLDANLIAENRIATATMIIHGRRGSRSVQLKSWVQGMDKSFSEYLAPAREKGTKMLKREDQLWIYTPQSDRIIKIAGHMLRQSLMGSDLSYEDMLEDPHLANLYQGKIIGTDTINGRSCWVLELTSREENVAYRKRKMWVDQERYIALREERFAKSGKLLKTTEIKTVFQIDDRWYPKRIIFRDVLSKGVGTELIINAIEFDADIPEYLFTKAALRK